MLVLALPRNTLPLNTLSAWKAFLPWWSLQAETVLLKKWNEQQSALQQSFVPLICSTSDPTRSILARISQPSSLHLLIMALLSINSSTGTGWDSSHIPSCQGYWTTDLLPYFPHVYRETKGSISLVSSTHHGIPSVLQLRKLLWATYKFETT